MFLYRNSKRVMNLNHFFNLPKGGKITGSTGNLAYAPLSDFRLSKSNQEIELTILPSPHAVGLHNLADVLGSHHHIVFHRSEGPIDTDPRPIVVTGDNSFIRNETEYPIILEASSKGNTIVSFGKVTDNGTNNTVNQIEQGKAKSSESSSSLQTELRAKFIHPGLLHNQAELDFIKQKVQAEEEPWFSGSKKLLEADISELNWRSKAIANVLRGGYNRPDIGASDLDMPYTLAAIGKSRPEGWHIQHASWATLLHARIVPGTFSVCQQ